MRNTKVKIACLCLGLLLCAALLCACSGEAKTQLTADQATALLLGSTAEQLGLEKEPTAYSWFIVNGTGEVGGKDCYSLYVMADAATGPGFAVAVDGSAVYALDSGEKLYAPTEAQIQAAIEAKPASAA